MTNSEPNQVLPRSLRRASGWLYAASHALGGLAFGCLVVGLALGGGGCGGGTWAVWLVGLGVSGLAYVTLLASLICATIDLFRLGIWKWWYPVSLITWIAATVLGLWGLQG